MVLLKSKRGLPYPLIWRCSPQFSASWPQRLPARWRPGRAFSHGALVGVSGWGSKSRLVCFSPSFQPVQTTWGVHFRCGLQGLRQTAPSSCQGLPQQDRASHRPLQRPASCLFLIWFQPLSFQLCPWHTKFLGQGLNQHHSSDLSHSSDNTGSLTIGHQGTLHAWT